MGAAARMNGREERGKKKAVYFTVDALVAASIIFLSLVLVTSFHLSESDNDDSAIVANDIVRVFSIAKVGEVQSAYVQQLIANGTITKANNTLFEQFGEFWAAGKGSLAQEFIRNLSGDLLPERFGITAAIDGEVLYATDRNITSALASSKSIISGIAKDKPTDGFTSKAYLTSIGEKQTSAFATFGGFVGQGNATVRFDDIPSGASLKQMFVELDAADSFYIFINGVQCGSLFTPLSGELSADRWNISSCTSSLVPGQKNTISVKFQGLLQNAYVGGGLAEAVYTTDALQENSTAGIKKEWLPEIQGIVNLFSSFYIPGTLNHLTIRLHYASNQSYAGSNLYLTIGNQTVLRAVNVSGDGSVTINDSNLTMLSYPSLGEKTLPFRLGFENISYISSSTGDADVALITDVSGSMAWRMDSTSTGTKRNCDDALLSDPSTRRVSVAKCLDKDFVASILNTSGNKVGLVAFESSTESTVSPTTNTTTLNSTIGNGNPETGYIPSGGTCICCGINSATGTLSQAISNITLIEKGATWLYTNNNLLSAPGQDPSGNNWYDVTYSNESSWSSGAAVLGATNGYSYSPSVSTEMGANLTGATAAADLWEHGGDTPGPPNDFSSGILNSTANTYGISGGHDGWDWDTRNGTGPFGSDDDIDYNGIVSGKLEFDNDFGGSGNACSSRDCSGAYAISINVTPEMYTIISSGGTANLSFDYEWDDTGGFESGDEVWIKARWTSPTSGAHDLGTNADSGDSGSDSDTEVAAEDDPDTNMDSSYTQDVGSWIEGSGIYYLEMGGKILTNSVAEDGAWRFDNVQLIFTNSSQDNYYLRKHFTISDLGTAQKGVLNVLSDDYAGVYLNGNLVDADTQAHDGTEWNRRGKSVSGSLFRQGDNVVAVRLVNGNKSAKFNLKLIGLNDSRGKAMMVMSDGEATTDTGCPQSGTVSEEAIEAACDAREGYGISVYSVAFSDDADTATMQKIAGCGEGLSAQSSDVTELQSFYQSVATSILVSSTHSEVVDVIGGVGSSTLYGDSYILMNYTPTSDPLQFDELSLLFTERNLPNCTATVSIPSGIRVVDAKITSYSSQHWTDGLDANGNQVYALSAYSANYSSLGDPFIVAIPPGFLSSGNNTLVMRTGDSPQNSTGCSLNNTFMYTGAVKASAPYSNVVESADGCLWVIETVDGWVQIPVPSGYSGANRCSYNSTGASYSQNDGIQSTSYQLFSNLDFDHDGKLDVNVQSQGLQIASSKVSEVPSLWGPAIAEIRVWN